MKTPIIHLGTLLLVVAGFTVAGCNASSTDGNATAPDPLAYQPAPEIEQVPPLPGEPAAAPLPQPAPRLDFTPSPNLADMIKLARAGVGESLILKFIRNVPGAFGLGAREIVYLNDLGLSENVINTMMDHDRAIAKARQTETATMGTVASDAATPETTAVEQQTPALVAEPPPVTVNYFYETLSPYGKWIEVDGYGRCWQPDVIAFQADWQPYCDRGRWIDTESGWYWGSDYSWGGVAFHYGRWFHHPRRGWCWTPDTVWSPAWVVWRHNDDYCGWAPLPPSARYRPDTGFLYQNRAVGINFDFGLRSDSYTFVSRNHFSDPQPRLHAMPRHDTVQIFNTTLVNNRHFDGKNIRVFNHGVAPSVIATGTSTQTRPSRPIPTPGTIPSTGFRIPAGRSSSASTTPTPGTTPTSHGFTPDRHDDSAARPHNPVQTQPPRVIMPSTPQPTPGTTPSTGFRLPAGRSSSASTTPTPNNHGFTPDRHDDSAARPHNPVQIQPPRVIMPSTPRSEPSAIVTAPVAVPHHSASGGIQRAPELRPQSSATNSDGDESSNRRNQPASTHRKANGR